MEITCVGFVSVRRACLLGLQDRIRLVYRHTIVTNMLFGWDSVGSSETYTLATRDTDARKRVYRACAFFTLPSIA